MDYLKTMENLSKNIPQDVTWEDALTNLVDMLSQSTNMTEDQLAILVGIGAMMFRQGEREFLALIPSVSKNPQ